MKILGALIVVLLIVVIYLLVKGEQYKPAVTQQSIDHQGNPRGHVKTDNLTYEQKAQKALAENGEGFQVCATTVKDRDCGDACGGEVQFTSNVYGDGNQSYSDFAKSWAVDDKVIENHMMFVADRRGLNGPEFLTGRTFSPDSHDSYNYMPWVGLRRPEAAEGTLCNPTQVPDVDENLFRPNRSFTFYT